MDKRNILTRCVGIVAVKFRSYQEQYVLPWWGSGGLASVPLWTFDVLVLFVKVCSACAISVFNTLIPPILKPIDGETILITDAGHGVGRELALQLAELGATVVCWDRDPKLLQNLAKAIHDKDGDCLAFTVNVTSREQIVLAAMRLRQLGVDVSIVVSCAGGATCAPLTHLHSDTPTRIIEDHLLAHLRVIQTFLPGMIERRRGHIVAINSTAGLMPCADMAPYCAAKFGLRGLMESLAEELRLDVWTKDIHSMSVYLTAPDERRTFGAHRFASWCRDVDASYAARVIINGLRKNKETISIPCYVKYLIDIHDLMPYRIRIIFRDFFNFGHRSWFYFC